MANQIKILAFAGSAREESFNKKAAAVAAKAAEANGASVTLVDLKDYPLPIFDQDLEKESGMPENAQKLKKLFIESDALIIASPEYNSSISPLLKNVIDWVSRSAEGEAPLAAFKGKVAAILSTSPGGLGGLRGLSHLRSILESIHTMVITNQIAIPKAHEAFGAEGNISDDSMQERVAGLAKDLVEVVGKLNN